MSTHAGMGRVVAEPLAASGLDYSTLAGLILHLLARIPLVGEHVEFNGWQLEVVDMDGRRIDKVLASRLPDHLAS
jgi:CBS domain containing-hemolysin-like protein